MTGGDALVKWHSAGNTQLSDERLKHDDTAASCLIFFSGDHLTEAQSQG